ncbi:unnamed protein product, partial [Prorocentrum cordatum]
MADGPARVLGLTALDGVQLGPTDAAWRTSASMNMGFAWSLYFDRKADERLAAAAPSLRGSELLRDQSPPPVLSEDRPRHCARADRFSAFSRGEKAAEKAVRERGAGFAEHGLELRGGEALSKDIRAFACRQDGRQLRAATAPERFWKIW